MRSNLIEYRPIKTSNIKLINRLFMQNSYNEEKNHVDMIFFPIISDNMNPTECIER